MSGTGDPSEEIARLTAETFEAERGKPLPLAGAPDAALTVVDVSRLAHGLREGGAFSVLLEGPSAMPLEQGLHEVLIAEKTLPLFLVPLLRDGDVMQYEAVFT